MLFCLLINIKIKFTNENVANLFCYTYITMMQIHTDESRITQHKVLC